MEENRLNNYTIHLPIIMEPLNVYLAEELAAAYVTMDASTVVLQDTVERMRMCISEVSRLNVLLNEQEEQLTLCRNTLTEEMARNARLELEARTMRSMITAMKNSIDRYRRYAKGKMDAPRRVPESFEPYYERRRIHLGEQQVLIRRRLGLMEPEEAGSETETEPDLERIDMVTP